MAALKKVTPAPRFDRDEPHGTLYASGPDTLGAAFVQGGHYFRGDGTYLGTDEASRNVAREPKAARKRAEPAPRMVLPEELPQLLQHPRAADLLMLERDKLAAMVKAAGGPAFSGDQAAELYSGWLIKYTDVDR